MCRSGSPCCVASAPVCAQEPRDLGPHIGVRTLYHLLRCARTGLVRFEPPHPRRGRSHSRRLVTLADLAPLSWRQHANLPGMIEDHFAGEVAARYDDMVGAMDTPDTVGPTVVSWPNLLAPAPPSRWPSVPGESLYRSPHKAYESAASSYRRTWWRSFESSRAGTPFPSRSATWPRRGSTVSFSSSTSSTTRSGTSSPKTGRSHASRMRPPIWSLVDTSWSRSAFLICAASSQATIRSSSRTPRLCRLRPLRRSGRPARRLAPLRGRWHRRPRGSDAVPIRVALRTRSDGQAGGSRPRRQVGRLAPVAVHQRLRVTRISLAKAAENVAITTLVRAIPEVPDLGRRAASRQHPSAPKNRATSAHTSGFERCITCSAAPEPGWSGSNRPTRDEAAPIAGVWWRWAPTGVKPRIRGLAPDLDRASRPSTSADPHDWRDLQPASEEHGQPVPVASRPECGLLQGRRDGPRLPTSDETGVALRDARRLDQTGQVGSRSRRAVIRRWHQAAVTN